MKLLGVFMLLTSCFGVRHSAAKSFSRLKNQAFTVVASQGSQRQIRSVVPSTTRVHITSVVRSRFAKVTTLSEVANTHDKAKELTFSVRLPEAAFISEFTMLVDDVKFVGKVKEKALALEEYEAAKGKDNPTGLVTADVRQTQTFNVATNVPAHSTVSFILVYQELLTRRLGKYHHEIFVNPGKLVDDFTVNVFVTERSGITMLAAKHPQSETEKDRKVAGGFDRNGEVPIDTEVRRSRFQAKVSFKPTPAQQRRLLMIPENDRKLCVIYDVKREVLGGELQTRDGYFVHYFAPENLPILPKKVVFVIDRSGSMSGRKMKQTKTAFETVLRNMSNTDEFNIVTFSGDVNVWKPEQMVPVTTASMEEAVGYVKAMRASGSTNLNNGVLQAADLLKHTRKLDEVSSAVILLTDGQPTTGVTNEGQIRGNVKEIVAGRFSVFCLGFGENLNHDFLKRLAKDNDGIARKIFEDSDADLQLEGFFQEVAAPLLLNVKIRYTGASVNEVSKTNFDKYFGGSEVVVVGIKADAAGERFESQVSGLSRDGDVTYSVVSEEVDDSFTHWLEDAGEFSDFIERIWAYFTIKELMEEKVLAETDVEVQRIVDRAMQLALKYRFVTSLTSMVVVLPEDETATTSSTSSTVHPPIPPCVLRSTVRDHIAKHPIWCPYVVDEADIPQQGQNPTTFKVAGVIGPTNRLTPVLSGIGPIKSVYTSPRSRIISSAARHYRRPSLSRRRNFSAGFMPRMQYDAQPQLKRRRRPSVPGFMPRMQYDAQPQLKRRRRPSVPEVSDHCGGTLNAASSRITSPDPRVHDEVVYCDWDVVLPRNSWIDLMVETFDAKRSSLKITSKRHEVVLDQSRHDEGQLPKYIYVAYHRISIRMKIDPSESENAIVLLYRKFVPHEILSNVQSDVSDINSPAPVNCGGRISSSDSDSNSGSITSLNYPATYPREANCMWTLVNEDPESFRLRMVTEADIETNELGECVYDKLVIAHGNRQHALCSFRANETLFINEPVVTITFTSDDMLESSGFNTTYEFVPKSSERR